MNEIIKITDKEGQQIVSARELHEFLEVKTDFTEWCKRMFDYGFEEGKEFTPILGKSTGGRPSVDYALTLDCDKAYIMIASISITFISYCKSMYLLRCLQPIASVRLLRWY
jgi:anti-repressor protein